ncbi:hypothetical protein EWM62_13770 [Mucilaginibacter terrigena]|uniref:Uncharacterized protein n=1 Tax=Mucilaginibacter terrigena TaxID=2492395 RepID=A0A4Q5LL53_9SPHI|nr:hypothetical protein [Mucilaginibacter terrigena]RYU89392.1 hypothetical protein EWM62_13770 [Mucilaginibacter terrigena]
MRSRLLFPHRFKLLGWLLALPGFVLGYQVVYNDYNIPGFELVLREKSSLFLSASENFTNELALTMVITGLLLIAFSKQKTEDELTAKMRLNALYWSILVNFCWYGVLVVFAVINTIVHITSIGSIVSFASDNLTFTVYNLFMPLVILIVRFYYLLYKNKEEYEIKPLRFLSYKPYRILGIILSVGLFTGLIIANLAGVDENKLSVAYLLPLVMLLWVYSKEKEEDEYINTIRLNAMQIAVYVNYAILLIGNFAVYGLGFLYVLVFNLATIPTIFLIVFHYRLYKIRQEDSERSRLNLNLL